MLEFPVTLNQMPKFEKPNNISINVYCLELVKEKFVVVPIRLTKSKEYRHVNSWIVQGKYSVKLNDFQNLPDDNDNDGENSKYHYVYIGTT